jgi:endothelin-converting enzyme
MFDIHQDIVKSFKSSLPHLEWMDKESADAASEKADAIRIKVGFPLSPDTRDPYSLARYYSQVNIERHSFFDNMLSAASVSSRF